MKNLIILFVFLFIGRHTFGQAITPKDTIKKKIQNSSVKNQALKKEEQGIKAVQDLQSQEVEKGNKETQDTRYTPGASGVRRSIGYKFNTLVSDTDPGNGIFRYNNESLPEVTFLFVNNNDISGEDQTNWYSTWDDTTGATARGSISVVEYNGENVNVFNITGVFIKDEGYWKIPVEYISGNLPVDGTTCYYIFNRISHKKTQIDKENYDTQQFQEQQPLQETQVNQEPQPKQVNQAIEPFEQNVLQGNMGEKNKEYNDSINSLGNQGTRPIRTTQPTRASQPTQKTQPTRTTEKSQPSHVPQVVKPAQTTQPVQTAQPAQTTQPVQTAQTTQVKETTQTIQITQPDQAAQITRATQKPQPSQTTQATQVPREDQGAQSSQRIPVAQYNVVPQSSQEGTNQTYYGSAGIRHRKCYSGIIEIGYALGVGDYGINNFRFNFINGIKIGQFSSIGLGIGFHHYYDNYENYTDRYLFSNENQVPVFLDLRTSFSNRKVSPYLALGIGGSAGIDSTESRQEGLFLSPSAGIWFNISERFAVFTGIAYELQKLEYVLISDNSHYKKNTSSISLNIGISF